LFICGFFCEGLGMVLMYLFAAGKEVTSEHTSGELSAKLGEKGKSSPTPRGLEGKSVPVNEDPDPDPDMTQSPIALRSDGVRLCFIGHDLSFGFGRVTDIAGQLRTEYVLDLSFPAANGIPESSSNMTTSSAELADDRPRKRSCFGRKKVTKKEGRKAANPKKFKEAPPKMIRGFQLKGIDFEVKKGELVAIVGAVGSGYG
jgi:ABC-type multidrug transport system fused ATPase/permease subunit